MGIRETADNDKILDWKSVNPIDFADFSSNHLDLWSKIQGAKIHHSTYGFGEISRVEQRAGYIPLIYVFFENDKEEIMFNSDSFKSGVIEKIQISKTQNDALQNWKKQFAPVRQSKHTDEQICFADFGVDSLWHMSHFNNLNNIYQSGILSYHVARRVYPDLVDISDPEVQRWREQKPSNSIYRIHEYVPLYVNPRNPMLYVRRTQQSIICLIEIDLKVLDDNTFLLTDGNAAASATRFFNKLSDLKCLPWDVLKGDSWSDKEDGKRKRCAEVLIYPKIDPDYIKAFHFSDIIPSLDSGDKAKYITPELFF